MFLINHFYSYFNQFFFCNLLKTEAPEASTNLESVAHFVRTVLHENEIIDVSYRNKVELIRNESWDSYAALSNDRQTLYRACNEFSWFSTSNYLGPPFDNSFPLSLFVSLCQDVFGLQFSEDFIRGRNQYINELFGGKNPNVANVYITYGQFDPYRLSGPAEDINPTSPIDVGFWSKKRFDLGFYSDFNEDAAVIVQRRARELVLQWISG